MLRYLLFIMFFVCTVQGGDLLINTDGRESWSLNGQWYAIIDPYETGYYNFHSQVDPNGYFNARKPKNKTERIEYDFETSRTLQVPGDWNTQYPDLFFYEGSIWYKKNFTCHKKANRRIFIYFGAANYHAVVWINGKRAGEHSGGFTAFNFEITDLVTEGANFVVVKVDNSRKAEYVPTVMTDWFNYGGLTRRVMLLEVPESYIQDYFIQLAKGTRDRINGWVKVAGDKKEQKITISIPEINKKVTVESDSQGRAQFTLTGQFNLWTPENPKLYRVMVRAETDEIEDKIGFRTIETKGAKIFLNGKEVFLRGICIHEEAPLRGGRAFSREDARILLGWAQELGCNFVRLAHYPHNELMTREADRMGIMVWSEIPVYWAVQWETAETASTARMQLEEMITRDKNKASVILWSMANETPRTESRLQFIGDLAARARELDGTRLVTAALLVDGHENIMEIADPLGEHLDVLGCNEYIGWYGSLPERADNLIWQSKYNKPLIISEFGAGALYGLHGDTLTRWSEEYQANVYKHQIDMLKKIPFLQGMSPWILTDFRSPRRPLPNIQDFWNRKGLISDRGSKKKAFYILQSFYEEKK
jgi:beta-glucuronidase